MEAIEKAKIEEFRDRVATQLKQAQEQLVYLADQVKQLQGAVSTTNYILNMPTVGLADEDEVTVETAVMGAA